MFVGHFLLSCISRWLVRHVHSCKFGIRKECLYVTS